MKYLLDTNLLIDFLSNKQIAVDKLSPLFTEGVAISVITVAEYLMGAFKSNNPQQTMYLFSQFIKEGKIEVLVIDWQVAQTYAKLQADFEQKGARVPVFDLLIASTALSNDLILISNDQVFAKIPKLSLA